MARLGAWLTAGMLVLFSAASPAAAKQVALVIGNDAYKNIEPLQKAVADATSYARLLTSKGFDVTLKQNLGRGDIDEAIAAFSDGIAPGDSAVFVYAGHGWSDGSQNYLLGTDAPKVGSRDFLARVSIPLRNGVNGVIDSMDQKGAALKVAIIDACRDNPLQPPPGTRGANRMMSGLVRVDPPSGTFVVFSAGAGQTALDRLSYADKDPNGVFTRVFVPLLARDMSLLDAVKTAQADVARLARSVSHEQQPAYYDQVVGSACLAASCGAPATTPEPDDRTWTLLKTSSDAATLKAFRDGLPETSPLRAEVDARLSGLMPAVPAPRPAATAPDPSVVAFARAEAQPSNSGWRAFLGRYPSSPLAAVARSRLAMLETSSKPPPSPPPAVQLQRSPSVGDQTAGRALTAFRRAEARGSLSLWRKFLDDYPDDPLANAARKRMASLESPPIIEPPRPVQTGWKVRRNVSQGIQNVRSGPGTMHAILFSMPAGGDGIQRGACRRPDPGGGTSDWCLISWRGHSGWTAQSGIEPDRLR